MNIEKFKARYAVKRFDPDKKLNQEDIELLKIAFHLCPSSLNIQAWKLVVVESEEKKKKIGCIYADIQTRGRGTRGKRWISVHGNLFGSIFFPLKKNYPPFNEFSIIRFIHN